MENEFFEDRVDAGRKLAEHLLNYKDKGAVVLAIARGGAPVGLEVAKRVHALFDVIVPRKIPIPWNPEAGFGAITEDGTIVLNQRMVRSLRLTPEEIEEAANEVRKEIIRRAEAFRGGKPPLEIEGKPVILVDDGLASGYTMLAAIESARKHGPSAVIVAVPVASGGAVRLVQPKADDFVALIISERLPFAVADFYLRWTDLTDEEVIACLKEAEELGLRGEAATRKATS
ncbi:MAG: phosphoribosyltransferase [Armatimonadetes bacterium]|nr:phosphoribosyltransferase [Armatimonadota bacterium]